MKYICDSTIFVECRDVMRQEPAIFSLMAAALLFVSCASVDGTRSSNATRVYDAPFGVVQDATVEAVHKSGFNVDYSGYDGAHVYSVRAVYDSGASRIRMSGSRGRHYRSSIWVKVERLEDGRASVEMSDPARRTNYGGGDSSRNHEMFWEELDKLLLES